MALRDDLLAIEKQLWTGGADAYRTHVDDDCLVAFVPLAGVLTRDEVASSVEQGPRWRDLEIRVEGMLRPSDNVAILTYRASAVRGDEERYHALVSSAYARRGDHWRLAFHHQTPLEG